MHYLDHAATTNVRPEAAEAFLDETTLLGNATSSHAAGRAARHRLDVAREDAADALNADPHEVVFTSGGTEADNLALKGAWYAARDARGAAARIPLVIGAIEHDAVRETAAWLAAAEGADVHTAGVGPDGRVDLRHLEEILVGLRDEGTDGGAEPALVSLMLANNETGAVQPIEAVRDLARALVPGAPVHTDAVQAVSTYPVDFRALGVDALSVSGHKIGAPVGCGLLLAKRTFGLVPVEHGGGQERGVRSGTLPVAQARALAAALRATVTDRDRRVTHLLELRERLIAGLAAIDVAGVELRPTTPAQVDPREVLPGHVHLTHRGARSEPVLTALDMAGVAASSGSACHAGVEQPSGVLLAMGVEPETARSALRVTMGATTTAEDVDALLAALPRALEAGRRAHPGARRPEVRRPGAKAGA